MRVVVLLVLAIVISGCASGYHPETWTGGYSDTQIAADKFRVSFQGNAGTKPGRVLDLAMLRCAERTLENGHRYFVVLSDWQGSASTQSSAFTQYYNHPSSSGYGAQAMAVTTMQTTSKPSASLVIQTFPDRPGPQALDAQFLGESIGKKYGVSL